MGGLLDIFFEKENTEEKQEPKKSIFDTGTQISSVNKVETQSPNYTQSVSPDLEKFQKHFESVFEKANLPGPDYFEFSKMNTAMGNMDEKTKFNASFAGLTVQGLNKETLLNSANTYIQVIEKDEIAFSETVKQTIDQNVEAKKKDLEAKKKLLAEKTEMITKLQVEIIDDSKTLQDLSNDISSSQQKIDEKISSYKIACETIKSRIKSDIEKINTHIN